MCPSWAWINVGGLVMMAKSNALASWPTYCAPVDVSRTKSILASKRWIIQLQVVNTWFALVFSYNHGGILGCVTPAAYWMQFMKRARYCRSTGDLVVLWELCTSLRPICCLECWWLLYQVVVSSFGSYIVNVVNTSYGISPSHRPRRPQEKTPGNASSRWVWSLVHPNQEKWIPQGGIEWIIGFSSISYKGRWNDGLLVIPFFVLFQACFPVSKERRCDARMWQRSWLPHIPITWCPILGLHLSCEAVVPRKVVGDMMGICALRQSCWGSHLIDLSMVIVIFLSDLCIMQRSGSIVC